MQLTCNRCGKPVTTVVPDGTICRAWVECPECVAKGGGAETLQALVDSMQCDLARFRDLAAPACGRDWFLSRVCWHLDSVGA